MLHLAVLGSGSSGNSALVCHGETRILVDAGLSARQIRERLGAVGVDPESLSAVVLTHEHGDHTRGLSVFCKKRPLPVYATMRTAAIVREGLASPVSWVQFEAGDSFRIDAVEVHSFPVPHDAVDPVGYLFDCGRSRLGVLSDVGQVTKLIQERLRDVDTLFAEANYDETLLMNDTKRPWSTKQRIGNRHGHLSNDQTAELVASVASDRLHRVVLGHLSSDCNEPAIAVAAVAKALRAAGREDVAVECAGRHEALPLCPVGALRRGQVAYEEISAESSRVCEPSRPAGADAAPLPAEWRQTEWAF